MKKLNLHDGHKFVGITILLTWKHKGLTWIYTKKSMRHFGKAFKSKKGEKKAQLSGVVGYGSIKGEYTNNKEKKLGYAKDKLKAYLYYVKTAECIVDEWDKPGENYIGDVTVNTQVIFKSPNARDIATCFASYSAPGTNAPVPLKINELDVHNINWAPNLEDPPLPSSGVDSVCESVGDKESKDFKIKYVNGLGQL